MEHVILTPLSKDGHGRQTYIVSNVGKPPFWPHDGDVITHNDIDWLKRKKGWIVTIR